MTNITYINIHNTNIPAEALSYLPACAGLTNQLLSCWVDPRIAWKNTDPIKD